VSIYFCISAFTNTAVRFTEPKAFNAVINCEDRTNYKKPLRKLSGENEGNREYEYKGVYEL
jgi:hypothetical protein